MAGKVKTTAGPANRTVAVMVMRKKRDEKARNSVFLAASLDVYFFPSHEFLVLAANKRPWQS